MTSLTSLKYFLKIDQAYVYTEEGLKRVVPSVVSDEIVDKREQLKIVQMSHKEAPVDGKPSFIPGVNFINVFTRSFYTRRSHKRKNLLELIVFFALLGPARIKAACIHVDEIDPRSQSYQNWFTCWCIMFKLLTTKLGYFIKDTIVSKCYKHSSLTAKVENQVKLKSNRINSRA